MSKRIIENADTFRSNIRNKIKELFAESDDSDKNSKNLEIGVYNWALKEATNKRVVKKWDNPIFVQIYLDHLRSIYCNLKNQNMIQLICSGEIKPQDVAFMTHQELCPDRWSELIKAKSIRDMNKFEQNIEAMTDIYKCRKCFSRKCTYMQIQSRSADESMTVYISCLACGNRWKTS
jgi:DNA-directed RNA polymerase subunit M/transcription elongation factor TFIIS